MPEEREEGDFERQIVCLVLAESTVSFSSRSINISRWKTLYNLSLADPKFNISHGVNQMIGVELCSDLLETQ